MKYEKGDLEMLKFGFGKYLLFGGGSKFLFLLHGIIFDSLRQRNMSSQKNILKLFGYTNEYFTRLNPFE